MELNHSKGIVRREQKTFFRKTRYGSVLKVTREVYLRNDISCGISRCPKCEPVENPMADFGASRSQLVTEPHLLIVDAEILLYKADVLFDDVFRNVVVPQTVWEEVKRRNPPAYKKMSDLVFGQPRGFYVFMNEFSEHTYTPRRQGESESARVARAVGNLAAFYREHLKSHPVDGQTVKAVLLTDTEEGAAAAKAMGLDAYSFIDYVNGITDRPQLADQLAAFAAKDAGEGKLLFPEYLSSAALQEGLRSGELKQGSFQVNRDNYLEAFVHADGDEEALFVQGRLHCNRAVHNDVVVVEELPKEQWSCPAKLLKIREMEEAQRAGEPHAPADDEHGADEMADAHEDRQVAEASSHRPTDLLRSVRVVGVLTRNWRPYCGVLMPSPVPGARRHLFAPAERRIPRVRIETRQADVLRGQRIVVAIDSWPRDSRYPLGHYVQALGRLGDKETENEVLLLEHDVPHSQFGPAVLACLPSLPWTIAPEERARRVDLTELNVCSVDPPGCTDIDDALHCRVLIDGSLEVGVHIADVSHFVLPATAMDGEAARRGTTVYLTDRRIDMLPELLSSNLCSLMPNVERFAFSVVWRMTREGDVVDTRFHKSLILSRRKFTYAEAQAAIDDAANDEPVAESLRLLNALAKRRRARRRANGALNLASMEIRFNIDSETHDPIAVQEKQVLETNSMVEEFMLLANISVGERINDDFPDCAVLRRHPAPPPANYKPVVEAAASRGFQLQVDAGGKALADSLDRANLGAMPFFNTMLRMLTTRCMTQALYFVAGSVDQSLYYHFGLATPIYTHFTSPIRRYADLLVHRLLASAVGAASPHATLLDARRLRDVCTNLNYRHRMAQRAGRASVLLSTHLFFKDKLERLEAYVLAVRTNALQVLIPKYGLESAIPLGADAPLRYDDDTNSLVTADGRVRLAMFDRVVVQLSLDTKDEQHHRLRLQLVEPHIAGFSVEPLLDAPDQD